MLVRSHHFKGLRLFVFFMLSLSVPSILQGSHTTGFLNDKTRLSLREIDNRHTPFNANNRSQFANTDSDTLICLPLDINLVIREYQDKTTDTVFVCVYDTISIISGYGGPLELLYQWSNGSSGHEVTLCTTGVGMDIQTVWLDVTDPQSGCTYSDTLTVVYQFGSCTGIIGYQETQSVTIFPNPAHDILSVEYPTDANPVQLLVINVNGQVVHNESLVNKRDSIDPIRLDLHFLPRGIYLVKLISEKGLYAGKILLD